MSVADVIVRGGTVVDGTGAPPVVADVEIRGDRIVAVGATGGRARRVIDADGLIVTPGFVDVHTHFDGQLTWDPIVAPSSLHGVTSVVVGNCGVGFAPAREDRHEWLISLLEGVEDIPGSALAEGLSWGWETFPEYLDVVAAMPRTVDVGAHVPHSALRTYVMGDRGADHAAMADDDELAEMGRLVSEAIAAGAVGFATSRTEVHRTAAGDRIPTLTAPRRELLEIAYALRDAGGVIQLISDLYQTTDDHFAAEELALLEEVVVTSGRPFSFTMQQAYHSPQRWRHQMAWVERMAAAGYDVKAQVATRPIGVLLGLEATANPFLLCAGYAEVASLPLAERVRALADDARRQRILAEHRDVTAAVPEGILRQIISQFDTMFRLGDPVDYAVRPDRSIASSSERSGSTPAAAAYDALLEADGRELLYLPLFNYAERNLDDLAEMIAHPRSLFGLSDAGAHCGAICDASMPTSALTMWARDGVDGERLPLETVVHGQTQRTAAHVGWRDRGVVAPGYLADLNLIDLDVLACRRPEIVHDLPAGGRRLMQRADGYVATIKSGVVTFEHGEPTGARPGELVRGSRPGPR